MNININFSIFELVYAGRFILKKEFFWAKFAQIRNMKYHYQIQLIWISLDFKFYLKQTILIFLPKFTQKEYFRSKKENVNIPHESQYI